jgi:hypothetical protein
MKPEEQNLPQSQNGLPPATPPSLSDLPIEGEQRDARMTLRRRLLIGGLVIPAGLAVMKPVKTLAKSKTYCSYSGWHSFKISSHTSAQPKKNCKKGYKSKWWYSKVQKKLPKAKKKNGHTYTSNYSMPNYRGTTVKLYQDTTFSSLFGSGSTQTISQCLASGLSNQCAFLTALFNAYYLNSYGYPFKYTDIYAIWSNPTKLGAGVDQNHAALFFQQLDAFG